MYRAAFVAEVVPGLVLVASALIAALPAFRVVRQSARGRARGAMAWIFGFTLGVIATMLLGHLTVEQNLIAGGATLAGGRQLVSRRCVCRAVHRHSAR